MFIDNDDRMSFKFVLFAAAAVFGSQVDAQIGGGIARPFATGFTNGFAEVAKPFMQLGQPVIPLPNDFIPGQRFPYFPQMMNYPSKIVPQTQSGAFEGFEPVTSGIPAPSYFQAVRPPVVKPPSQFFQFPSQPAFVRPTRPFPATFEESIEMYRPSNLLVKPDIEVPKTEEKLPVDAGFEGPSSEIQQKE